MADWTQLPSDLLHLISKRLHTPFDVVRFRSVCSTWRSVVTSPGLHRLAPSFLFIPANSSNWSKWSDYNVHDFVLLSISDYGDLEMFKSSDQRWTPIFQDTSSSYYDDVVFYKENFYAVDIRGKILVVGLDSKISVVGEPIEDPSYDGRRKYLVESKGELFLIAMYWSLVIGGPRVFKLDEVSKEWIEVNNLNDRELFIGNGCAFAATAEDLFVWRGNYIVFVNSIKPLLDVWDVRVFDLEDGSIRPLSKFPQLDKLFSPHILGVP
ncbi:hypothetical protein PTKIN_Ptkin10aG0167000 [Pterospermum kingtungense]